MSKLKLPTLAFSLSLFAINNAQALQIKSENIRPNQRISEEQVFNGFGCSGQNISPQISWNSAPYNTKSFAVTVYDPDAPTGSGWWHWLVVNIPASQKELPLGFGKENKFTLSNSILQIRNDFGTYAFGGPCPPANKKNHRYIITVYALKVEKLDLKEDATAALAGFMINQNIIAKTQLIGLYGR